MTEPYSDLRSPLADAQERRRLQRELFIAEWIDAVLALFAEYDLIPAADRNVQRMLMRERLLREAHLYVQALNDVDQALINRVVAILSSEIVTRQIADEALAARVAELEARLAGADASRERAE